MLIRQTFEVNFPKGEFHLPELKEITVDKSPVKPPLRSDLNQPASMKLGASQWLQGKDAGAPQAPTGP